MAPSAAFKALEESPLRVKAEASRSVSPRKVDASPAGEETLTKEELDEIFEREYPALQEKSRATTRIAAVHLAQKVRRPSALMCYLG